MNTTEKTKRIQSNFSTMLCVGLDSDVNKLPDHLPHDASGVLEFNKNIIEATSDYCCSYKINFAFYEKLGWRGWQVLEQTRALIPDSHVAIADAKRGDLANTAKAYASAIFDSMAFDAVTINAYQGEDSAKPFLNYKDKLVFILALTSNSSSRDFQYLDVGGEELYKYIMRSAMSWSRQSDLGFVVGATHTEELELLRALYPDTPFLIPGVGAQGASASAIRSANKGGMAFVNSSRAILFASSGSDYATAAREAAQRASRELSPSTQ